MASCTLGGVQCCSSRVSSSCFTSPLSSPLFPISFSLPASDPSLVSLSEQNTVCPYWRAFTSLPVLINAAWWWILCTHFIDQALFWVFLWNVLDEINIYITRHRIQQITSQDLGGSGPISRKPEKNKIWLPQARDLPCGWSTDELPQTSAPGSQSGVSLISTLTWANSL